MFRYYFSLCFVLAFLPAISQNDLVHGLLACFSFTGNANDGSGNGNHGTVFGAELIADRYGNPNSAYQFDGVDDYISIPPETFLNNEYTFTAWIRIQYFSEYIEANIISIGDSVGRHQSIHIDRLVGYVDSVSFSMGLESYQTGSAAVSVGGPMLSSGKWYHVVAARTATDMTVYANGVKIISTPNLRQTAIYGEIARARIGRRCSDNYSFKGTIDDVSIYNRGLSDEEVLRLYQQGLSCSGVTKPKINNVAQCGSGAATLMASGGTWYRWYDSEQNLIFEGNPFFSPVLSETTTYYVSNMEEGRESEKRSITVTVFPELQLQCNFPDVVYMEDQHLYPVEVVSGTSPVTFTYYFEGNNGTVSSTPDQTHTYFAAGLHTVTVIATDAKGCKAMCSEDVNVKTENIFIPNVITDNGDSFNGLFTLYLKNQDSYIVYDGVKPFSLHVYDRWGKEVFSSQNSNTGWTGESVSSGVYFYRIALGKRSFKGAVSVHR